MSDKVIEAITELILFSFAFVAKPYVDAVVEHVTGWVKKQVSNNEHRYTAEN
jgi:hypothetical protein